jgi:hypothetical protein
VNMASLGQDLSKSAQGQGNSREIWPEVVSFSAVCLPPVAPGVLGIGRGPARFAPSKVMSLPFLLAVLRQDPARSSPSP